MKRFKGFAARRRSFELPIQQAAPGDVHTQDHELGTQSPKLKKISQVVGIDSPPSRDGRHGISASAATDTAETNARAWRNPLRGRAPSRGSSFSSSSDAPCCSSSSSRLSDASLPSTSGNNAIPDAVANAAERQDGRRAIVVAFDANARDPVVGAVAWAFQHVVRAGDVLALLGVMDFVRGPLGYKCQVNDQTWLGANARLLREEIAVKTVGLAATPGLQTLCTQRGVKLAMNVKAAARPEVAIVQEAVAFCAVQVVLDRSLKIHSPRKRKFYVEHLKCDVTRIRRSGGVEILRSNSPTATTTAAATLKANSDDEELFTIDHCVASTSTLPHRCHDGGNEPGYESDDLFSICDVDNAWRTSSFASQLILQHGGPDSPARNSTVAAHDFDPAMACFVPPRSSVESGPRLDKRLLSMRLQLRN